MKNASLSIFEERRFPCSACETPVRYWAELDGVKMSVREAVDAVMSNPDNDPRMILLPDNLDEILQLEVHVEPSRKLKPPSEP